MFFIDLAHAIKNRFEISIEAALLVVIMIFCGVDVASASELTSEDMTEMTTNLSQIVSFMSGVVGSMGFVDGVKTGMKK